MVSTMRWVEADAEREASGLKKKTEQTINAVRDVREIYYLIL